MWFLRVTSWYVSPSLAAVAAKRSEPRGSNRGGNRHRGALVLRGRSARLCGVRAGGPNPQFDVRIECPAIASQAAGSRPIM